MINFMISFVETLLLCKLTLQKTQNNNNNNNNNNNKE